MNTDPLPEVRERMHFQGFGGQWNINKAAYQLKSASNIRHIFDFVPCLTPANWVQDYGLIKEGSWNWNDPLKFHDFKNIYAPQIIPIQ